MKCHFKQKFGITKIASYGQVLGLRASNKIDHTSCDIHNVCLWSCASMGSMKLTSTIVEWNNHMLPEMKFLVICLQAKVNTWILLWWGKYPFIIAISISFDVAKGAIDDVLTLLWCQILLLVPTGIGCQRVRGNWGYGAIFQEGSLFYEKRCAKKRSLMYNIEIIPVVSTSFRNNF